MCKGSDDIGPRFQGNWYVFQLLNIYQFKYVFQVILDVRSYIVHPSKRGIYPGYFAEVILCTDLGHKEKF